LQSFEILKKEKKNLCKCANEEIDSPCSDDEENSSGPNSKDTKRFLKVFLAPIKIQMIRFIYTGCRKINVFQVGDLVGKNLRNLEKIK
jgi:hypothetical protein